MLLLQYFRDVYLQKKLELDKTEENISEFINTTFNSVFLFDLPCLIQQMI